MGKCKNEMKITARELLPFPAREPIFFCHGLAFWTVAVAAGVVAVLVCSAIVAGIHVAAELGRSAYFYGPHDFALLVIHDVSLSILVTVQTEDVGYLIARLHGVTSL